MKHKSEQVSTQPTDEEIVASLDLDSLDLTMAPDAIDGADAVVSLATELPRAVKRQAVPAAPVVAARALCLPNVVKLARTARRKSVFRDADTLRAIRGLEAAQAPAAAETSVRYAPSPTSPSTPATPTAITSTTVTSSSTVTTPTAITSTGRKQRRRGDRDLWFARPFLHPNQPRPRSYRGPADWRDTTDQLRITMAHRALQRQGATFGFTLDLRPDIEAQALARPDTAAWLADRIARHTRKVTNHPQFYVTLEQDMGRLHLHGAMVGNPAKAKLLRKALRDAGGEWEHARQFQCHLEDDPDEGWASYACKELWKASDFMRQLYPRHRQWGVTFGGSPISITKATAALAAELYAEHVEKLEAA